jgi:putative ATP-dependent endonuclease of the OLD family
MRIRLLTILRYRGLRDFSIQPGARTVLIGPNNTGKSTVLEALDLLLHPGLGRPRPSPTELDYFGRTTSDGFEIEAVMSDLSEEFIAEARDHLEGWNTETHQVVPEPDGPRVIPAVRVRVVGSEDLDVTHEFAKPESAGARFGPRYRTLIGWVFDGRVRDPSRQLAFYKGGVLDRLFEPIDLGPAVGDLRDALGRGASSVNEHESIDGVLTSLARDLRDLGLLGHELKPGFEVGAISERELLQALRLAIPTDAAVAVPPSEAGARDAAPRARRRAPTTGAREGRSIVHRWLRGAGGGA